MEDERRGASADGAKHVVVIGGGVAGLSAAHHLTRQGYRVHVVERRTEAKLGGKAYSYQFGDGPHEHSVDGLPGEHGFRFFPGFYQHVIATMGEIGCTCARTDGHHHVSDHLVELDTAELIRAPKGRTPRTLRLPVPTEERTPSVLDLVRAVLPMAFELPWPWEDYAAAAVLTRLVTACPDRWLTEYEHRSWWDVSDAWRYTDKYAAWFAKGLTRSFVATQAEEMSARTGGKVLLQLLYDVFIPQDRSSADRVLDGPTSEVWIEQWVRELRAQGVTFHCGTELTGITLSPVIDRAKHGRPKHGRPPSTEGEPRQVVSGITTLPALRLREPVDHYVLAVSCKALKNLLSLGLEPLLQADPDLTKVFNLETRWMNGAFFFLTQDDLGSAGASLPRGHTILLDSEWALTMLDQQRVWAGAPHGLEGLGRDIADRLRDEGVVAILSVDVSDWKSPGACVPPGNRPQPEDVGAAVHVTGLCDEIWSQIRNHLPGLAAATPTRTAIDPSITMRAHPMKHRPTPRKVALARDPNGDHPRWVGGGGPIEDRSVKRHNADELLVNTAGSWEARPAPTTALPNLFLVGDYVATTTDFASMEAADESARRATNAMLVADGREPAVMLWPLRHPTRWWFAGPRQAAVVVDRLVTHPLKMRAPYRVPMAAMAPGATIDGVVGRFTRRVVPGPKRIAHRTDGSPTLDVDPGP